MANDNLAAFLGGSGAGEYADLNQFEKTLGQNNTLRQIAAPVLGAKFDTSTWSPGQVAATTLGQAFLGTILSKLGENQVADQLGSAASVLPQLYADPASVNTPAGVDPEAFGQLKLSAMKERAARNEAAQAKQQDALQKIIADALSIPMAGQKKAAEKTAELQATNDFYNTGAQVNPDSPVEKKVSELRDKFNALEDVQNYKYVNTKANQLVETLKNPSAFSDQAIAKMVVQFVEPKMAVNAGEGAALAASNSIPEYLRGLMGKALKGESVFDDTARKAVLDIAASALKAHGNQFANVYKQYANEAGLIKQPMSRISSLELPASFDMPGNAATAQAPKASDYLARGYTIGVVNGRKVLIPPVTAAVSPGGTPIG